MKNISNSKLKIELATPEILENLNFNCGDDDLNEFIMKDSIDNLRNNLCVIYLLKYENEYIAYFSLSADSIQIDEPLDVIYPQYPAIKIGRLAVSENFQNKGIGTKIILWIQAICLEFRKTIGIRFLSVDAYNNKETIHFYKKNFFKELNCNRTITKPLYLDLNHYGDIKMDDFSFFC